MENQTINGKLLFAKNAITNGRDVAAISTILTDYGYTIDKMNEGMALYETVDVLHTKQKKEYGEQYAATEALQTSKAALHKTYIRHLKLARIALKDDKNAEAAMQLSGSRKESFSGWLQQVKAFYNNGLVAAPATLEALAKLTISVEVLTAGNVALADVEAKYNAQLKEKGEAQAATEARDKAFDSLQDWISDFIAIARIALEDQPQLLEILGIKEPS